MDAIFSPLQNGSFHPLLPRSLLVGYAQKNLQNGAMIVTPQFLGIATENGKVELQSITCRDEDSDLVVINVLDSVGAITKSYNWTIYGGNNYDEKCWIDGATMAKPTEPVYFDPGQSLWVEGDSVENSFITAGKVGTSDVQVQLQNGATLTGNAIPVDMNLQDITCRDEDSDLVVINLLDSVGAITKSYNWTIYGGNNYDEKCWIDGATMAKPTETVSFKPGTGLWVEADSQENIITFPGVEL